jgi:hypothetical protein
MMNLGERREDGSCQLLLLLLLELLRRDLCARAKDGGGLRAELLHFDELHSGIRLEDFHDAPSKVIRRGAFRCLLVRTDQNGVCGALAILEDAAHPDFGDLALDHEVKMLRTTVVLIVVVLPVGVVLATLLPPNRGLEGGLLLAPGVVLLLAVGGRRKVALPPPTLVVLLLRIIVWERQLGELVAVVVLLRALLRGLGIL